MGCPAQPPGSATTRVFRPLLTAGSSLKGAFMTTTNASPLPNANPTSPVASIDSQHVRVAYSPSEIEHRYGKQVHILRDPLALAMLGKLCQRA